MLRVGPWRFHWGWNSLPLAVAVLTLVGTLVLDSLAPLGIAVGVLYALAVAASLSTRDRSLSLLVAAIATGLIVAGWLISPRQVELPNAPFWNRLLSIAVVWMVAGAGFLRERTTRRDAELLLESTAEAIYGLDLKGRCIFCNPACARMLGYGDPAQLVGRDMHALVHHTTADGTPHPVESCRIYQAFRRGEGTHVEGEVLWRKDGSCFPVEYWSHPVLSGEGVVGSVVTFLDISDRQAAREALQRRTRTLETVNRVNISLAAELDLEKLLQQVTDAGRVLSGAEFGAFFYNQTDERGELLMLYTLAGRPPEDFAHLPMPRATDLFGPTLRGEGVIRVDDVLADPRYGRSAPYHGIPERHPPVRSYLAVPVISRSGEVHGGLFYGHAETAVFDREAEELVTGIAAQAAVAIDNARLYQTVQQASRQKDEFLAMLAHELRNPLHPLRTATELLVEAKDPATLEHARGVVVRQLDQMSRLLDDLLDVARISSGKIELRSEPCSVQRVVRQAVETSRPSLDRRSHAFELELPDAELWVQGDPARLVQVISNLLDNAAKYTAPGGHVGLHVEALDEEVSVGVRDDGMGIAPDLQSQVFDLFVQGKTGLARSRGGLGLGLHLVQRLVEQHGGRVSVHSAGEGRGSEFRFWLPLAKPPVVAPAAERAARGGARRILVVDDHPDAAQSLAIYLEQHGHEVRMAVDGPSGLQEADGFEPEVAILDIGLPGMDGYELAQRLRGRDAGGPRLLIALSGYGNREARARSAAVGFHHHLLKPAHPRELLDLISQADASAERQEPGA